MEKGKFNYMDSVQASDVKEIVLACEAGMGSSLMVVNSLKKKLKKAGVTTVSLKHKPVRTLKDDTQLVVVHKGLAKLARKKAPDAVIVMFNHFLNDPAFDKLVAAFVEGGEIKNTVA